MRTMVEIKSNQGRRFRDLGVVELTAPDSLDRKRELIKVVMETLEEVKHGSGQVIIAGGITDRQKRHLICHLNRYHKGLRDRISLLEGSPIIVGTVWLEGQEFFSTEGLYYRKEITLWGK